MKLELPKYKREFCCDECGLIWFTETTTASEIICPECGNSNRNGLVYACDSMGFAYAYDSIVERLKEHNKSIQYEKDHPYYGRK